MESWRLPLDTSLEGYRNELFCIYILGLFSGLVKKLINFIRERKSEAEINLLNYLP